MGDKSHCHRNVYTLTRGKACVVLLDVLCDTCHLYTLWDERIENTDQYGNSEKNECCVACCFLHCYSVDKKNESTCGKQERGMEFPIRCFTCGLPISGKWKTYLDMVKAFRRQDGRAEKDELVYLTSTTQKTAEGRAMDELGLTRECCRRHFLTHPGL
jgi:DNA-directed RNA polymerase subunit N (RpoN/RPB10)